MNVLLFHNKCVYYFAEDVCVCSAVVIACARMHTYAYHIDVHAFSFKLWTTRSDSKTARKKYRRSLLISNKSAQEERSTNTERTEKSESNLLSERVSERWHLFDDQILFKIVKTAQRGMRVILVNGREQQTHIAHTRHFFTTHITLDERAKWQWFGSNMYNKRETTKNCYYEVYCYMNAATAVYAIYRNTHEVLFAFSYYRDISVVSTVHHSPSLFHTLCVCVRRRTKLSKMVVIGRICF